MVSFRVPSPEVLKSSARARKRRRRLDSVVACAAVAGPRLLMSGPKAHLRGRWRIECLCGGTCGIMHGKREFKYLGP